MSTPLPVPLPPGQTPYVTADQLLNGTWPTGVSFKSLPPGRTVAGAANNAAVSLIAAEATSQADAYCNQPLRATSTTEVFHGPGDSDARVTIQNGSQLCRIILQRLPVLTITQVQAAPNRGFPRQFTTVPSGFYEPEYPALGLYNSIAPSAAGQGGQAILIAPGYVTWYLGRNGYVIQVSYTHGWPHSSLTAVANPVTAPATQTITVDDCTGWAVTTPAGTGAAGVIYDGGSQEAIKVTASSAAQGPGTLTLAAPLLYEHQAGVMVSSLPQNVIWATAMFAAAAALTRGATATSLQEAPGRGGGGGKGAEELANEAEVLLHPYKRTI